MVLDTFNAISAIGGGIAMLVGADKFPVEWLRNTPFSDYTIPAFVLAIVVGGSSLIAAVTVFTARSEHARVYGCRARHGGLGCLGGSNNQRSQTILD